MVSPSGYSSLFLVEMDNTQSSQTPGRPQRKGKLAWITNVAIRFYRFLRPRKIHQNSRTTLPPPPIQNSNLNNNEPSLLVRSSSMPSSCDTSLYTIASTIPLTTNTSQSESLSKNMANTVELAKTKYIHACLSTEKSIKLWYRLTKNFVNFLMQRRTGGQTTFLCLVQISAVLKRGYVQPGVCRIS